MYKKGGQTIMAKKENREGIALQCTVCKNINYLTSKNKQNTEGKLEVKKFCKNAIRQLLTKKERQHNICLT